MATSDTGKYKGTCFCGAVEVTAKGAPVVMGYCHCKDCRAWSGGPVTPFTIWPRDAVEVSQGSEFVGSFSKTGTAHRKHCTKCGGHLLADIPGAGIVDVFAGVLPSLPFEPSVHVHYESTVMKVKDGLPKMKDLPSEAGGSGELLPE